MLITRRIFNRLALTAAGSKLFLSASPAAAQYAVALQPLAAQAARVVEALQELGQPLSAAEIAELHTAFAAANEEEGIKKIQQVLDQHVLFDIDINPESMITLARGEAKAELVEQGWRTFLLKVYNEAPVTSTLTIVCPQSDVMGRPSVQAPIAELDTSHQAVDAESVRERWVDLALWDRPPMQPKLSGLAIEYRILQVYSRDHGQREASFWVILDTQRPPARWEFVPKLPILFECLPSKDVKLRIHDADGSSAVASLLITDSAGHVYPPQGKRSQPDLWFERQIYRRDGSSARLPAGEYTVVYGRGPEYLLNKTSLTVTAKSEPSLALQLERWVTPRKLGYYSGDTHIHGAGCSHYESPMQGVTPDVLLLQAQGEALDIGDVLNWEGGYYFQGQFFTGHIYPDGDPSRQDSLLRYDLEISGFPSSQCGHLVLLRLADPLYPGVKELADWPSWNLPILRWTKAQGGAGGYGHAGLGLVVETNQLPNYLIPSFDGVGALEYIVDVTHEGAVDFISGCNTQPAAELNIWYHTMNCGYRTPFVGETDFPCLSQAAVGAGRTYVKMDAPPDGDKGYSNWIDGLKAGRSYVSEGRSHIFDLKVEHTSGAFSGGQLVIDKPSTVSVSAQVCARLEPEVTEATERIRNTNPYYRPRWHIERARIGKTRKVTVELIVNGFSVQQVEIEADGTLQPVYFDEPLDRSSWIALRIYPSSHANPVFVHIGNSPIRASRASAKWCREAVDACWKQLSLRIRPAEQDAAKAAYDHARAAYDRSIVESHA